MDIKVLKQELENKHVLSKFLIFKYSDTDFIPFQYIEEIKKITGKQAIIIEDLSTLVTKQKSLFINTNEDITNEIKIYITDKFETSLSLQDKFLYIICKSIEKSTKELYNNYIIEIPKLEDWQIKDFVYSIAEGVTKTQLDNLIEVCDNDIYRINNELEKITLFSESERKYTFNQFVQDGIFNDLSKYTIFDFSNAIIYKNKEMIKNIYNEFERIDIEPIGLVTILLNNIRNIIKVQLANSPTPETCGMKAGQFYAIKKSCGLYTKKQLLQLFDLLTDIDRRIKLGEIPVNRFLIDYLIISIFSLK